MHDPKLCSGFSLCGVCRHKKKIVLSIGTFSSNGIFLSIEHCIALNFSHTIENRLQFLRKPISSLLYFMWISLTSLTSYRPKRPQTQWYPRYQYVFCRLSVSRRKWLVIFLFHSFDRPQRCVVWGTWPCGLSFNCRYFHKSFVVQEKASAQFILLI